METKYFGEYLERNPSNNLPAIEMTGIVWVRNIKGTYLAFLKCDDGKMYDLPKFMIKYTNRKVALIARVYSKVHNVKVSDNQSISKTYNKLVVIRAKPTDILESELMDIDTSEYDLGGDEVNDNND